MSNEQQIEENINLKLTTNQTMESAFFGEWILFASEPILYYKEHENVYIPLLFTLFFLYWI